MKFPATRTGTALLDQQWCNPSSFPREKIGSTTKTSLQRRGKTRVEVLFSSSSRRAEKGFLWWLGVPRGRRRRNAMAKTRAHELSRALAGDTCTIRLTEIFGRATKSILGFFIMVGLCNGVHYLLRPFSQPRITSDTIVSLFFYSLLYSLRLLRFRVSYLVE